METKIEKRVSEEVDSYIPKIKCKICGNEEIRKSSRHCYCDKCKIKATKLRAKKYRGQENLQKMYNSGNNQIIKNKCITCGKMFFDYKVKRRRFCKMKCQYEYASKHWKPENTGKNRIEVRCLVCGKKFKSYTWAKQKFCSRRCYEIDHKENWEFPHKGKSIDKWMFKGNLLKLEKYRKELKIRMIKFFKANPEFLKRNKDKSLIEIYGKINAEIIRKKISKGTKESWENPENREKWLKTNGRFKKGEKPWNTGKKLPREYVEKAMKTKERNYLNKLGITNGN